jgi:hypothetical protein
VGCIFNSAGLIITREIPVDLVVVSILFNFSNLIVFVYLNKVERETYLTIG